jgi:cell division protein ZapA
MERKSIKVKIFGSEYPLRGESEEFTRQVAAHVDEMISAVHGKIPDQPPLTVAVLSALNITEDLLKERERGRKSAQDLEGEIGRMTAYMESCMREG